MKETYQLEFKQQVRAYLEKKGLSFETGSNLFGVSRRTLFRYLDESTDLKKEFMLDALEVMFPELEAVDLAKRYPEVAQSIQKRTSLTVGSKKKINAYKSIESNHELFLSILCGKIKTKEEVRVEFGSRGLASLEFMLKEGTVKGSSDALFISNENITFTQVTHRLLSTKMISQNYKHSKFGLSNNWLTNQVQKCDKAKVGPEIVKILRRTNDEIRSLFNKEENKGNDILFVTLCSDDLVGEVLQ